MSKNNILFKYELEESVVVFLQKALEQVQGRGVGFARTLLVASQRLATPLNTEEIQAARAKDGEEKPAEPKAEKPKAEEKPEEEKPAEEKAA